MAGRSGVGSGAAAASGSAKTAPVVNTVVALSMSRLESLLSRMSGPAAYSAKTPRATLNVEKDITPLTTLQGCCHPVARGGPISFSSPLRWTRIIGGRKLKVHGGGGGAPGESILPTLVVSPDLW